MTANVPRRSSVAVLVLIALAAPAAAHPAFESRLAERLDAATAGAVARLVEGARSRGLPAEPLVSKALEGAAKGARGDRIVAAVQAHATALDSARSSLGPGSSDAELVAGAGALLAGVPMDSLARLRAAGGSRSLVVPLVVLADLVARRVPAAAASSAVLLAARAGARDPDLMRLRRRVERDIAAGATPGTTAILRARTLMTGPEAR